MRRFALAALPIRYWLPHAVPLENPWYNVGKHRHQPLASLREGICKCERAAVLNMRFRESHSFGSGA